MTIASNAYKNSIQISKTKHSVTNNNNNLFFPTSTALLRFIVKSLNMTNINDKLPYANNALYEKIPPNKGASK